MMTEENAFVCLMLATTLNGTETSWPWKVSRKSRWKFYSPSLLITNTVSYVTYSTIGLLTLFTVQQQMLNPYNTVQYLHHYY